MLHLRPDRRLVLLRRLLRARLVQLPPPAGLHRRPPVHRRVLVLVALADALVARVAPRLLLAAVQNRVRRRHVRPVRRRRLQAVRQARPRVHPDVRLHPEVPPVALLRPVHLRIPLPLRVLRRTRRLDDARVHDRPLARAVPKRRQVRVDLLEQPLAEPVLLQQVPELQDRHVAEGDASSGSGPVGRRPANRRTDSTS